MTSCERNNLPHGNGFGKLLSLNAMKPYLDHGGDSGIAAYECGRTWIRIQFKDGDTYEYRATAVGAAHVKAMKKLADAGAGLNTYINTHAEVKSGASKL